MASTLLVFPGDPLVNLPSPPPPSKQSTSLKVGPGVTLTPPSTYKAHKAGELNVDERRHAVWIEANGQRYIPSISDPIIATVLRSSTDTYICSIPSSASPALSSTQASLPHLAFSQATKKNRPVLHPGASVYARVSLANKYMDPELECFDQDTGKADGFGELKGGMLFPVSLGVARRLLGDGKRMNKLRVREINKKRKEKMEDKEKKAAEGMEVDGEEEEEEEKEVGVMSNGMEVLEELGKHVAFEIAVGRNGRVWVDSADPKTTLWVGRCIQRSEGLTGEEQRRLVREAVKAL